MPLLLRRRVTVVLWRARSKFLFVLASIVLVGLLLAWIALSVFNWEAGNATTMRNTVYDVTTQL